jgi:fructose 1,6-bisphosphatase
MHETMKQVGFDAVRRILDGCDPLHAVVEHPRPRTSSATGATTGTRTSSNTKITDGKLIRPRDMFADPSFDRERTIANEVMDYLRRHGPFEPHRLPLDEIEYTTMPAVAKRLDDRWSPIPDALTVVVP